MTLAKETMIRDILERILLFVLCPGGPVVAIVGAVFLVRRKTRLGVTLVVAGALMLILWVIIILYGLANLG